MKYRTLAVLLCLALPASLLADFRYQQTTQITGGSVLNMMKVAGTFSKQARQAGEPVVSTVYLRGNRMAHVNRASTQIVDLDKELITDVDHEKRQYTVMTFQQMREMMAEAARRTEKSEKPDADMSFSANVRNTGATKQVSGVNTTEAILTMQMQAQDKKTGAQGGMSITNDMWLAPEIPGYAEVRDFERRYAEKLGMALSGALSRQMASMQAGSAKGMAEMAKEMAKLKGTPILQVMRMGSTADGKPLPAASEAPLPPADSQTAKTPSSGEVAQEGAASSISSKLGGLGGGLMGGFGRKKKQPQETPPSPEAANTQEGKTQAPATAGVLMESSTELSGFSASPVEDSVFQVPAGYKQVDLKK